jgi:hypothetical protein
LKFMSIRDYELIKFEGGGFDEIIVVFEGD